MYYKCEMLIGGQSYIVTDHIKNWEDMTVSFKRNEYDGVVRSFTDKFEFVKGARQLLLDEFKANYLRSSASIVLSTRNNSWLWAERFRCALDFSTINDDGFTLSINAIDDSVASLIKARKGTQYEYPVEELAESQPLYYDRLELTNQIKYALTPNVTNDETFGEIINGVFSEFDHGTFSIPLYVESSEIVRKDDVEIKDQQEDSGNDPEDIEEYFFKNTSTKDVVITITAEFKTYYRAIAHKNESWAVIFIATGEISDSWAFNDFKDGEITDITLNKSFTVAPGKRLKLLMQGGRSILKIIDLKKKVEIKWESKADAVSIDVIKPEKLLNKLLGSIGGDLQGVIVPSGEKRLDNAVILAAESVRNIPKAKIYSSFSKFCDWMRTVFGYVYDINGKTVTFRFRKDYFQDFVSKKVENYSGYQMRINSSLIYSQLNIGYEKQDYDSINGKDEFRFTNYYNTGTTLTDNKLELISPYRADAYGIEFLAQTIGEDTTDNSSDTGIFFVCASIKDDQYILDRSDDIQGVFSSSTMFNSMYSPSSMILANADYLGGFISELNFASSDGNSGVFINGEKEDRNFSINGGLFTVEEIELETSDIELPDDMTGIVEFEHNGETLKGYYISSDFNYTKTKSAKISLIMKK